MGYTAADAVCLCQQLADMGCRGDALREAYGHLTEGGGGHGLTYSNVNGRRSVVAVGFSEDRAEMANTVGHELLHVVAHICGTDGIDMGGEEPCYIMGELCERAFKVFSE